MQKALYHTTVLEGGNNPRKNCWFPRPNSKTLW